MVTLCTIYFVILINHTKCKYMFYIVVTMNSSISVFIINSAIFIMDTDCILCEVRT